MSYIGKTPTVGNFIKLDDISTSSTNSYTLQHNSVNFSPESALHMMVSLNGVIQAPNTSYTVSGSTITFLPSSGTLSSSDSIDFIMVYGNVLDVGVATTVTDSAITRNKLNLISDASNPSLIAKGTSGVSEGYIQLNCAENSHGIKLKSPPHSAGASYTLTFPNDDGSSGEALTTNGSGVLTWASAGANNSPNFHVYDANQTLNNTTWTKFTVATERFDNGSAYDTSTSRFTVPSGEGGVYLFNGMYRMENDSGSSFLKFYKNGSALNDFVSEMHGSSYFAVNLTIMVNLSASDYIEMYGYINVGNTNGVADINFQGFKIG